MKFNNIINELRLERRGILTEMPKNWKVTSKRLDIYDMEQARSEGFIQFGRGWQDQDQDDYNGIINFNDLHNGHGHPANKKNTFYWGLTPDKTIILSGKTRDMEEWLKKRGREIANTLAYGERRALKKIQK